MPPIAVDARAAPAGRRFFPAPQLVRFALPSCALPPPPFRFVLHDSARTHLLRCRRYCYGRRRSGQPPANFSATSCQRGFAILLLILHQLLPHAAPLLSALASNANPSRLQVQPSLADSGAASPRRDVAMNSTSQTFLLNASQRPRVALPSANPFTWLSGLLFSGVCPTAASRRRSRLPRHCHNFYLALAG